MTPSAKEVYASRRAAAEHGFARWQQWHSRYVLVAVGFAFGVVFALVPIVKSGGSLPLFFALLVGLLLCGALLIHARGRSNKAARVIALYEAGQDRISGKRIQTGHTGETFAEADHVYARDLDVVGANSLFGTLATTRTALGQRELARYVLRGVTAGEAAKRQGAVQELTSAFDLRESVALLGKSSFEELPADSFERWLQSDTDVLPVRLQPLLLAITVGWLAVLIGALLLHVDPVRNVAALLALQGALSLRFRSTVQAELDAAERLAAHAGILRNGLRLLRQSKFETEQLQKLQATVASDDPSLAKLQQFLVLVDQRAKEWYYVPALLLAAGTQAAVGLQRWKRQHAAPLLESLRAWGEFDALLAMSTYAAEHPANVYPELVESSKESGVFEAAGLRHPLLPADVAVANDVRLDAETRFLLISGSNMAGKSTLLRAIGINAVMALAGLPVPARALRMNALHVGASLVLKDSLAERKSKFLAEVERLRAIVALAQESRGQALFLVDEIFSGTNSLDRKVAAEAVLRSLIEAAAIGALSTHDLTLTELADLPELHGQNIHMASAREDDPLAFDYKLKSGVNRTTNALAIVKMLGLG